MQEPAPVSLVEDGDTGDQFLIYSDGQANRIELRYEGDTLWMTQSQIAQLFDVTRQAVNNHLTNIYQDEELDRDSTCKEILQVRTEGGREVGRRTLIHNLDAIIAVGYRVSTKQGTLFRRWATETLVRFATKGFVIDARRLKRPDEVDRLAELREVIRDIRSDEANVFRELRRICALCRDYAADSQEWRDFYRQTQAKIVYAVTSHTPAEIVRARADANQLDMGLTNWPHPNIRKTDVATSKNYLADAEVRELNRLTTILLDIFEDQADLGRLVMMDDARALLDRQLAGLGRVVLSHGGGVAMTEAKRHAENEYARYDARRRAQRHAKADAEIAALKRESAALPSTRRRKP